MSKFLKSLVIGTATGLATAYFLTTEKGKEVKGRAEKAYNAYKENPEEYHQMAKEKGTEYSNLAKERFNDYKHKFETGEITPEQVIEVVKEKTNQFVNKASKSFSEGFETRPDNMDGSDEVVLTEDDIIIDYSAITEDIPVMTTSENLISDTAVESEITKAQASSETEEVLHSEI
ncbi:YtxH domain-containing protein [Streptococcus hongkongensis]|nr:hypothetical protein NC01_01995 [Streptococcus uberis]